LKKSGFACFAKLWRPAFKQVLNAIFCIRYYRARKVFHTFHSNRPAKTRFSPPHAVFAGAPGSRPALTRITKECAPGNIAGFVPIPRLSHGCYALPYGISFDVVLINTVCTADGQHFQKK
jgi:hypothetical protein